MVQAELPGASPETVATSVSTPLERHLSAIAGVQEMTSQSSVGSSQIVLIFDLDRNIRGAASDVEAAIQAARQDLPTSLRSNPTYQTFNPADAAILIIALSSKTLSHRQIYDAASTVIQQKLSELEGVGAGADRRRPRCRPFASSLNPLALFKYGIGLEDVRAAISAANANAPKGAIEGPERRYQIYVNDTATTPEQYRSLVIAYRNGAAVRLGDVGSVSEGVEDVRLPRDGRRPLRRAADHSQAAGRQHHRYRRIASRLSCRRSALPSRPASISSSPMTLRTRSARPCTT